MKTTPSKKHILAILTALCGLAAALEEALPAGSFQRGAAYVARSCEAAGLGAEEGPNLPSSPSMPAIPPAAPVPGLVPEPTWLNPHVRSARHEAPRRPWVRLTREAWRGESRGWALTA